VTYDVVYDNAAAQGATWTDEQAAVVVVDNGTSQPAVFFASIPNTLGEANIATLVSSLQLSSPSAGQPDATATPTDDAQNGDNSQNGDNNGNNNNNGGNNNGNNGNGNNNNGGNNP
jgi:hypothetical protein